MINKHDVMYEYIQQCPQVRDLFFNFGEAENGNTVLSTGTSEYLVQSMVDGSAIKWYDFTIIQYLDLSTEPNDGANVNIIFDVETFMDWIAQQDDAENYPDFGEHCCVTELSVLQSTPTVAGQDQKGAKYMFSCRVEYLEERY